MRRRLIITLAPVFALGLGCAGDSTQNEFSTAAADSSGTATDTGTPADMPETGGQDTTTTAPGDGDGAPGDGDGSPTTTTAGDGDGDTGLGVCGDGKVDIGEQCDGADLNGFTCVDLGYDSGDLACDPVTCTYDASNCVTGSTTGNTTGGTSG